ncbi:MAG TPA: cell envelope integrity protein TolA, partial [Steroidobacteraceae bacterium]|nr:cell envelope integrity protein TolA [Steroidobacteraceae bacterium]
MSGFLRENSRPLLFSVLLHGGIVAALLVIALMPASHHPSTPESAPVNATVVDSRLLHAAQQAKADQQAAQARAAAEARASAEKAAADAQAMQQAQEAKALEQHSKAAEEAKAAAVQEKAAEQARAAESAAKAAAEAKAAAAAQAAENAKREADARKAAQAKAVADAKAAAEAKAAADAKAAAQAKAAADAKAAAEDLRKELGEEEHADAVEASPLRDRYVASLRNRIQNAWIKPPSAKVGVDCLVEVTQVPGGEVTSAKVTQCTGDAAVR